MHQLYISTFCTLYECAQVLSPELIRNIAIIYVLCVLKHPQFTALEKKYRYGKINIGMPVFMDDIATAGKAEHIRKGIKNCKDGKGKEDKFWSKENKIYDS